VLYAEINSLFLSLSLANNAEGSVIICFTYCLATIGLVYNTGVGLVVELEPNDSRKSKSMRLRLTPLLFYCCLTT
jgi:hypothetical protein